MRDLRVIVANDRRALRAKDLGDFGIRDTLRSEGIAKQVKRPAKNRQGVGLGGFGVGGLAGHSELVLCLGFEDRLDDRRVGDGGRCLDQGRGHRFGAGQIDGFSHSRADNPLNCVDLGIFKGLGDGAGHDGLGVVGLMGAMRLRVARSIQQPGQRLAGLPRQLVAIGGG